MVKKSVLKMAGCIGVILIGLVFVEMAFTEPGEIGQRIMMLFVSFLFFAFGILYFKICFKEYKENAETDELTVIKRMMAPGFEESPNRNELEEKLSIFRDHYADFLKRSGIQENDPIQEDVTQLYRNMLDFRKNRLKRLGVTCNMQSKRMIYQNRDGVKERIFTDGKYDISDVIEEIAAKTSYEKDGKEIFSKVDKDIASYTLIHAKQVGEEKVICPNCGSETSRTALLDGCDFCGTKFTVEDLGTKVAEFALRPDYDIELAKYKKARTKMLLWIMAAVAFIALIWILYWVIRVAPEVSKESDGIFMTITSLIGTVIFAGIFIIPCAWFLAGIIVAPVMTLVGTGNFVSNRILKRMKDMPKNDENMAFQVRRVDPLFSINNFYSGVQNKLSSIIYADNLEQVQAFANCNLSNIKERYQNVIGIDMDCLNLRKYNKKEDFQFVEVQAVMRLTEFLESKCKVKKEEVTLYMRKASSCKTQVVCAPSFMRCSGCGASLDLLKGKKCAYCGHEVELEKHDWVITGYKVM